MADLRGALRPAGPSTRCSRTRSPAGRRRRPGVDDLLPLLEGPIAIAFVRATPCCGEGAARFGQEHPALVVKGGLLGRRSSPTADIEALADIEPARRAARLARRWVPGAAGQGGRAVPGVHPELGLRLQGLIDQRAQAAKTARGDGTPAPAAEPRRPAARHRQPRRTTAASRRRRRQPRRRGAGSRGACRRGPGSRGEPAEPSPARPKQQPTSRRRSEPSPTVETEGETTMATMTTDDLLDVFKNMTVLELNEFLKAFEEEFGVTAAAPVAVARRAARVAAARRRPGPRSRTSSTSSSSPPATRRSRSSRRSARSRAWASRRPRTWSTRRRSPSLRRCRRRTPRRRRPSSRRRGRPSRSSSRSEWAG